MSPKKQRNSKHFSQKKRKGSPYNTYNTYNNNNNNNNNILNKTPKIIIPPESIITHTDSPQNISNIISTTKEKNQEYLLKITQSGKIRNYVEKCLNQFQEKSSNIIILSGKGTTITKTISIAEIIKRKMNGSLHQYNQIGRNFLNIKNIISERSESNQVITDDDDEKCKGNDGKEEEGKKNEIKKTDKKNSQPTITIYLSTNSIPHLESSIGYQPPILLSTSSTI
ncbi:hypothetical protein Glove_26g11 [Diversispora epigaea]|uniref:DNA/RNA-binding protein Alba-like domain-containing protein n=1 Tax=Diversispora epigaea TaxID=1348612 RepID=A0A397JPS4_9GLOM|nr:hypothetical protein Glove_26g11 [Diversispora epigaea]